MDGEQARSLKDLVGWVDVWVYRRECGGCLSITKVVGFMASST